MFWLSYFLLFNVLIPNLISQKLRHHNEKAVSAVDTSPTKTPQNRHAPFEHYPAHPGHRFPQQKHDAYAFESQDFLADLKERNVASSSGSGETVGKGCE
jgi:hypothetical protein